MLIIIHTYKYKYLYRYICMFFWIDASRTSATSVAIMAQAKANWVLWPFKRPSVPPSKMGGRDIAAEPAPLVPVFSKTLKHKCVRYHKSLKNGEK